MGSGYLVMIFAAVMSGLLGHACYRGLQTGVSSTRYGMARRDRQPFRYWTAVVGQGFASVTLAVTALVMLWMAWAWDI